MQFVPEVMKATKTTLTCVLRKYNVYCIRRISSFSEIFWWFVRLFRANFDVFGYRLIDLSATAM